MKSYFCCKNCKTSYQRERNAVFVSSFNKNLKKPKEIKYRGIKNHKEIICPICNNIFIQRTIKHIYCSKKCSKIHLHNKYFEENYKNYNGNSINLKFYKIRFEIFKRDNFTCQYCGRNVKEDKIKLHLEHIIPKNKGGDNSINNLTTSCEECNLGKGDVLLEEHLIKKP